jgi:DNA-binding CsgD family transcriptional regulator
MVGRSVSGIAGRDLAGRDLAGREIVGRDVERRYLAAFLEDPVPAVAGLLLDGDAGIGKTALWEWATQHARGQSGVLLVARAGAVEARLPWVGLTDLLRGIPRSVLEGVPIPQFAALRVIMLEAANDDESLDDRTVGTAMWTVLSALSAVGRVTIAVDDIPYLDTATASALRFALRRLAPESPVRVIATARAAQGVPAPFDALDADRFIRLDVGPMSLGAVYELISVRLGIRFRRPTLVRLHDTAGGNPLYAMELARALSKLAIEPEPGAPLPVPFGLDALIDERVRALPPGVLDIVAGTAAAWHLTDAGLDPNALAEAIDSGVVIADQGVVRSAHPLLGAAAYAALTPQRRRALHERLAAITSDLVEHARHTALAATGPDREIARTLDAGAHTALAAGTPDIAVELYRLALVHTGTGDDRTYRLDGLADGLMRTGDTEGSLKAALEAVALTASGSARARRRIRAAEIMTEVTGGDAAIEQLYLAVEDAGDDREVRAEALLTIAAITDDAFLTDQCSRDAVALLESAAGADPRIVSGALAQAAGAAFIAGRGLDHKAFARAIDIERTHPMRRLSDRADSNYAALLKYADDLDRAEPMLTALLAEARESGDISSISYALGHLPQIPLWRGDLDRAEEFAEAHLALATQADLAAQVSQARFNLGWVRAYQGRLDEAQQLFDESLGNEANAALAKQRAHAGLGFVSLSRGDATAAATHLDRWHHHLLELHWREPGYSRGHLDYLVSHVTIGALDDAAAFLDHTRNLAENSGRRSTAIVAITGQALIDAASGRLRDAQQGIGRAVDAYHSMPLRFDRARTLFLAGQIHRRAKAKGLARDALNEAHSEFVRFGATAWVTLTDAERARVHVRPTASRSLTETERRIAELSATGLTNRQVAQRMFIAPKTVEANLARVYHKLGIRSRAELGLRLADENTADQP